MSGKCFPVTGKLPDDSQHRGLPFYSLRLVMTVPDSLSQLLTSEITGLETFCTLLGEEQKALTGASAERLSDIAVEKASLASRLSQLESARDSWLVSHGHTAGRAGMDALLASRPESDPELLQWQKLLELAGRAKAENETNGKLIALLLRHNQEALAALLSNGGGSIYGPDGQPRNIAGGRSFGAV